jgi:hypothetical protein
MPQFDSHAGCVCCDRQVLVRSGDWTPTSAVVCLTCLSSTPFYVIRAVFIMRTQIAQLWNKLNEVTAPAM